MNFRTDLTTKNQKLLKNLDITIEDKDCSREEIQEAYNAINTYVMSKSSKNGDLANELNKHQDLMNELLKCL